MTELDPLQPDPEDASEFRLPSSIRKRLSEIFRIEPFSESELSTLLSFVSRCVEDSDNWKYHPRTDSGIEDLIQDLKKDLPPELQNVLGDDQDEADWWKPKKTKNPFYHPSSESYNLVTAEGLLQISRDTGKLFARNPDDAVDFSIVLRRPRDEHACQVLTPLFLESRSIRISGDTAQEYFQRLEQRRLEE